MKPNARKLLVITGAVMLVALIGVGAASKLEEQNAFCNSCHTHSAIYARFTAEAGSDLATQHMHGTKENFRCIFCHREPGISGHAVSLFRGGMALGAYLTKNYDRPIKADTPPTENVCRKCHKSKSEPRAAKIGAKRPPAIEGHYHSARILRTGAEKTGEDFACSKCHTVHDKQGQKMRWLAREHFKEECVRCHKAMGGLGEEMKDAQYRKVWVDGELLTDDSYVTPEAKGRLR